MALPLLEEIEIYRTTLVYPPTIMSFIPEVRQRCYPEQARVLGLGALDLTEAGAIYPNSPVSLP